jgi:hypothetical protein
MTFLQFAAFLVGSPSIGVGFPSHFFGAIQAMEADAAGELKANHPHRITVTGAERKSPRELEFAGAR